MGSNHEKKLEVENLVTLSLSCRIGLATCRKNRIRVSNRHVEIASGVCRKGEWKPKEKITGNKTGNLWQIVLETSRKEDWKPAEIVIGT